VIIALGVATALWLGAAKRDASATAGRGTSSGTPARTPSSAPTTPLTPAPSVAAAEQNQAIADGCELAQTAPGLAPECRYYPDNGKGDVVLVGDSHAAQWLPAVAPIAKSRGWGLRVWTRANCPLADVTKIFTDASGTACNTWRDDVMNRLIADRPSLVVVSSYPPPGGQAIVDPATGGAAAGARARAVYAAGMRHELDRLLSAGIHTLLIEDLPRFNETAPQCATQHPTDLGACSRTEASSEQSSPDKQAAQGLSALHTLDLTPVFCSSGRCHQIVGSIIAYRDNNHLSHEMVRFLIPRVESAMALAMSG
jgi:hypothetical protein